MNFEDEDDYDEEDGSIEDLAGRIRNDSASDLEDGIGSDDLVSEEDVKPTKKAKGAAVDVKEAGKSKTTEEKDKEMQNERKKQKRIESLDKRLKKLLKKHEKERKVDKEASEIKNKHKRLEIVERKRLMKNEEKVIERLKKKKLREEQGEDAAPRGKTNTIESMRVADETLIEAEDEDIKGE